VAETRARGGGCGCVGALALIAALAGAIVFVVTTHGAFVGLSTRPVVAADIRRIDITDLIRQSRAIAVGANSHARLTGAVARGARAGLVDASEVNAADVTYEYRYADPAKPAGRTIVAGSIAIAVYLGSFAVIQTTLPGSVEPEYVDGDALAGCTSQAAWQAAVRSGIPAGGPATIRLENGRGRDARRPPRSGGASSGPVWTVTTLTPDERRRDVDARTCSVMAGL